MEKKSTIENLKACKMSLTYGANNPRKLNQAHLVDCDQLPALLRQRLQQALGISGCFQSQSVRLDLCCATHDLLVISFHALRDSAFPLHERECDLLLSVMVVV